MIRPWLVLLVVVLALSTNVVNIASAQNRAHFADVELVGPLADVELDLGAAGRTRIEGSLRAGESRRVHVPCPSRSEADRVEPVIRFAIGDTEDAGPRGRAKFLGFFGPPSAVRSLAPGLRARPRPAVAEASVRVSRAAFVVLAVGLVLAISLRRRPVLVVVVALAIGVGTRWLVAAPSNDAAQRVTSYDGDVEATTWLRVDAGFGEVEVPEGLLDFELAVEPSGTAVVWHVPLDPRGVRRATASGARLYLSSVFDVGENALTRARNTLRTFDACWLREEGAWTARGAWPTGAALSEASSTAAVPTLAVSNQADSALPPASAPPGWLATGLPQGLPVWIGREAGVAGKQPTWWRIAGL